MTAQNNIVKRLPISYELDRPFWGPHFFGTREYGRLLDRAVTSLKALAEKGGTLILTFGEDGERPAMFFLKALAGAVRREMGQRVEIVQFLGSPYLAPPPEETKVWFIYHAPKFQNLNLALEHWIDSGKAALIAGRHDALEQRQMKMPIIELNDFMRDGESFSAGKETAWTDISAVLKAESDAVQKAFYAVALLDAWGSPPPFDFLIRIVGADEDELDALIQAASDRNLLFWVERDKPPFLLVSTGGESFARFWLRQLDQDNKLSIDNYAKLFEKAVAGNRDDRWTVLSLLQALIADSRFRLSLANSDFSIRKIREAVQHHWGQLNNLIASGTSVEKLIWGLCLARMGLFDLGIKALEEGIRREPENIYLLQAKAHLLGQWAQFSPERREGSTRAFSAAARADRNNPYVLQAWGKFEAETRNYLQAERCFDRALAVDPANICTLVARADMNLDRGKVEKAEEDIKKALALDNRNFLALHVKGRIRFHQGNWPEAHRIWNEILEMDDKNIYALQSLGNMARVRGDWEQARNQLEEAYDIDPESVPVLLESGMLELDKAKALPEADRRAALDSCAGYLDRALEVAPGNPKVLTSLSSLKLEQDRIDEARTIATDILEIWPDNLYARHVLARAALKEARSREAENHAREMIGQTRGAEPLPYFLMAEMDIQSGNKEEARESIKRAERALPESAPAIRKIGVLREKARLLLLLGDADNAAGAKAEAESLINLSPQSPAGGK